MGGGESRVTEAVAVFSGQVRGAVYFQAAGAGCNIGGHLEGLTPGEHGLHIHRLGDLTKGCKSTCEHFNPDNSVHGGAKGPRRHAGDLGNISADANGVAEFQLSGVDVSLGGSRSVVGRGLVVHRDRDDLGMGGLQDPARRAESLRTGNAGDRLACAVIGISKERGQPGCSASPPPREPLLLP